MRLLPLLLSTLVLGCADDAEVQSKPAGEVDTGSALDGDGDGYTAEQGDCDDANASVGPNATEVCDGVDNDCDGEADVGAADAVTAYADADGDGYGDAATGSAVCALEAGWVEDATDCDDGDALTFPGADEVCDLEDNDCDGEADEGSPDARTYYADADSDGYGDPAVTVAECGAPEGYVETADDCDDADARAFPGATEVCDGADNDCDGAVDVGATDATDAYGDADGDGFGDPTITLRVCALEEGWVADATDCDDSDALTYPGADEVCDVEDNDCDGEVDEGSPEARTYYADADGDGYGDPGVTLAECGVPAGYVETADDCDDADALAYPGATEVCDGVDNDCNGDIDETGDALAYLDADGDGFGAGEPLGAFCDLPVGTASNADDCDDARAEVNPAAEEVCDGADNDCDGSADVDAADLVLAYADIDGDGFGDAATATPTCALEDGWVGDATDCDDADSLTYPGAPEVCDLKDNNCDGAADEGSPEARTYYADADGDGYGDPAVTVTECGAPAGYVETADDCDDADAARSPGATEVCDGADNDCDGAVDIGAADGVAVYADADGDTYGDDATLAYACTVEPGFTTVGGDCDDAASAVSPDADEVCDGVDNDCDTVSDEASATDAPTWYLDADADGYGAAAAFACEQPAGFVAQDGDCDDADPAVYPAAAERCDGLDNDCDGTTDPSTSVDASSWYADADADGYGDAGSASAACDAPAGTVANDGDCDDADPAVSPAAAEACDALDNDCDGSVDEAGAIGESAWYLDADADGHGDALAAMDACEQPYGYVLDADDCDDADTLSYPGATETCDTRDNDCDGAVDEGALDSLTVFADMDGDGYGDPASSEAACAVGVGQSLDDTDCDDAAAAVNPAAVETCNDVDDDCDSVVDPATAADAATWYADADADGYGDLTPSAMACDAPAGTVANADDCDDASAAVNPAAVESCNAVDDDCDGVTDPPSAWDAATWYADADADGYGDLAVSAVACDAPAGSVANATDCDDATAAVNPGAVESCNDVDDDCDGVTDPSSASGAGRWYADADADGYGNAGVSTLACDMPAGSVANATDCDDAEPDANPGESEACDEIDNDCDGSVDESGAIGESTWYVDADGDGWGATSGALDACFEPAGYTADDGDCDDGSLVRYPGAVELADGLDNDCDGSVDEGLIFAGDVIISEFSRQPRVGGTATNTNAAWFELYNTTTADLDLSEVYITRVSSAVGRDAFYVDPADGVVIPAGGYAVFCKTDDYTASVTAASDLVCDYYWGDETLASTASGTYFDNTFNMQRDTDTLAIYVRGDATTGTLVDQVTWTYDATSGYWPRDATRSTQLDNRYLNSTSNDSILRWCSATANTFFEWYYVSATVREFGTPGTANHTCP